MPDERIFGVTFEDKLAKFGETPNIPHTFAENLMFGVIFGVLSGAVYWLRLRAVESQKLVPDRNFQGLTAAAVIQILCLDVQREGSVEGAVSLVYKGFGLSHLAGFPPFSRAG